MPMDHLLPVTADIYKWLGYDGHGQEQFGAHVRGQVRLEPLRQRTRMNIKENVNREAIMFTRDVLNISNKDRVLIEARTYRVTRIESIRQITGQIDHLEVMIMEAR